jgi:hypothetical protein
MLSTSPRFASTFLVGSIVLLLAGCPDAAEELDRFDSDYKRIFPPTSGAGGAMMCAAPEAGALDGDFVFAVSANLDRTKPLLFDTDLVTTAAGDSVEFSLTIQPLNAMDRMTPLGSMTTVGPFPVNADGTFVADLPPIDVPGEANPISGNPITADITLTGALCPSDGGGGAGGMSGSFFCGTLDGFANEVIPLMGSTWTMEELSAPGMFPDLPKINCAGDLAEPL